MDLPSTAKALAERVEAEATQAKVPVAVGIIDIHSSLVLQQRMNGAPAFSLELSGRKREGQLVAGVGVSGGTTEQDIAIVEAALLSEMSA